MKWDFHYVHTEAQCALSFHTYHSPRNFAKARAKDATAKAQRNYFGKQRLNILGKSLSTNQRRSSGPLSNRVSGSGLEGISLAHAQRHLAIYQESPGNNLESHFQHHSPPPNTIYPSRGEDTVRSASRGGGRSNHPSRILSTLDTSERASFRMNIFPCMTASRDSLICSNLSESDQRTNTQNTRPY